MREAPALPLDELRLAFARPLLAVLATLSLVIVVAIQPRKGPLNTVVLAFASGLLGAALVRLAESLDAAAYTRFGGWFSGN